jgi:hypothetical protein
MTTKSSHLLIPLLLAYFVFSSVAEAQTCPSNCDNRGNTADRNGTLAKLTSGQLNTAVGDTALFSLTSGISDTAVGWSGRRKIDLLRYRQAC